MATPKLVKARVLVDSEAGKCNTIATATREQIDAWKAAKIVDDSPEGIKAALAEGATAPDDATLE